MKVYTKVGDRSRSTPISTKPYPRAISYTWVICDDTRQSTSEVLNMQLRE